MAQPSVPRSVSVLAADGKIGRDWDLWLQTLALALNGLSTTVRTAGAFANPNTHVVGSPGAIYTATAGGAGTTLWVKESGVKTNTGWVAK